MHNEMKKLKFPLFLAVLAPSLHAAVITSSSSGSWASGAVWSDGNPAASGNDYVIGSGHRIESPSAATATFPGDSLTVGTGGILELYRDIGGSTGLSLTASVPNLTINGGTLRSRIGFATGNATLSSAVDFDGGGTIEVSTTYGTYSHTFTLNGAITGDGAVNVFRTSQGSGRTIVFNGDVTGFSGDWSFSSTNNETLNVTFGSGTGGWGSGDLAIGNYASLSLNAGTIDLPGILSISSTGGFLNVSGTNTVTVGGFKIDGVGVADGTWGAVGSGAEHETDRITGTGMLNVVPEPGAAFLGTLGTCLLLFRRRDR